MHMRHSFPSIAIVSRQNSPAVIVRFPDFLASMKALDSGKHMRTSPTAIEIPAGLEEMLGPSSIAKAIDMTRELTSNPEDGLPSFCATPDTEIGTCCKHVAQRIPLLKNSRHESSGVDTALKWISNGFWI